MSRCAQVHGTSGARNVVLISPELVACIVVVFRLSSCGSRTDAVCDTGLTDVFQPVDAVTDDRGSYDDLADSRSRDVRDVSVLDVGGDTADIREPADISDGLATGDTSDRACSKKWTSEIRGMIFWSTLIS